MFAKLLLEARPWWMTLDLDFPGPTYLLNVPMDPAELQLPQYPTIIPLLPLPGSLSYCPFRRKEIFLLLKLPYGICISLRSPLPHCLWDLYPSLSHRLCHLSRKQWTILGDTTVRAVCYWHLVGRGQGCYQTPSRAQSRPCSED